jgi:AraC family transcriptional regulator of adaptative response / DNA-3-methyladenine glycosylase II
MSVTEVAFAAGFESLRRFNTAFKDRYRLAPTSLRRDAKPIHADCGDVYNFQLSVRPPFDLQRTLAFWQARATAGVEQVLGSCYRRTAVVGDRTGWIVVGPGTNVNSIHVGVSKTLGPALATVLTRLKSMLDVRAEPSGIGERLRDDPFLAPLLAQWPGPRVPGAFDGFECGIRAILGQQISMRAATTLAGRMAARFGKGRLTPFEGLVVTFPSADSIAGAGLSELRSIGLTSKRAETVQQFAIAVADGRIRLDPGADPDRVRAGLLALPGIGEWTAEYLLLRAVGWPDAFPYSDLGLLKATRLTPSDLRARAERWRPWRSYAAVLLWQSLTQ